MTGVVDASAAVRIVRDKDKPLRTLLVSADHVIVPELFIPEVCSAFWKYFRAKVLSRNEAESSVHEALGLFDEAVPMGSLTAEVLKLTATTGLSVYDLFYVALAKRHGAMLLTADGAMRRAAVEFGIEAPEVA